MAWVKQSDRLWSDAKFCAMSDGAQALWHRANSYIADHLLDGLLPDGALKFLSTRKRYVQELEDEGYWIRQPSGGWLAASWQENIQSKAQVLARRSQTLQRVRGHRNAVTNAVSNAAPGPGPVPDREEAVASSLSAAAAPSQIVTPQSRNVTPFAPRRAVSAAAEAGMQWYAALIGQSTMAIPAFATNVEHYEFFGNQSADDRSTVAKNLRESGVHGKSLKALSPKRIAESLFQSHLLSEQDYAEQKSKYASARQPAAAAAPVPSSHKLMQF